MLRLCSLGFALSLVACGGASTPSPQMGGRVACDGWASQEAPRGTVFSFPGAAQREPRGGGERFMYADGPVYLEVFERAHLDEPTMTDAMMAGLLLTGLGAPERADVPDGWRVTRQQRTEYLGRDAVERVIDIDEETLRVETMVRAGTTLVVFIVMVRYADMVRSEAVLECFERSVRFPAPPNR